MKLSQQLFRWHRITGLIAGGFLLLLSFTGSLLVFSDEIDHALNQRYFNVEPKGRRQSLNTLYEAGSKALPGNPYLTFQRMPQAPEEALVMRAEYSAENKVYLYVDPYTAEILHTRGNKDFFTGFLLYLHFTLMSGRNGSIIILFMAAVMLVAIVTGVYVYRKHLWKVLTFRDKIEWKFRRRRWRNLHRIAGVWSLVFNLLIVITGILIQWKVVGARVGKKAPSVAVSASIDFESLTAKARSEISNYTIMAIRPPRTEGGPVLFLGNAGEPLIFGEYGTTISLSPDSGKVVKKTLFNDAPFSVKWDAAVKPLHFGNYGGIPLKILYSLLGLTPGVLALSGILIWFRRKWMTGRGRITKRLQSAA
ncbi:PepSY-associated TM helix domain-containing protein [Chitinophaga rhizosphaerae]|uniref:PepSY-associated TM helix domain-containing protein n=1 Tax=Chitinophaga rhizosphaerae TaxID=1864947 RepID=UPI000F801A20|nr:PepSY-associated TM helix domain-containing protein [Chitinophaga rhizosphaerae]